MYCQKKISSLLTSNNASQALLKSSVYHINRTRGIKTSMSISVAAEKVLDKIQQLSMVTALTKVVTEGMFLNMTTDMDEKPTGLPSGMLCSRWGHFERADTSGSYLSRQFLAWRLTCLTKEKEGLRMILLLTLLQVSLSLPFCSTRQRLPSSKQDLIQLQVFEGQFLISTSICHLSLESL